MKIIMMRGLQASGKSTHSKELCKSEDYYRVGKDELRAMMLGNRKWSYKLEKLIVKAQTSFVIHLLEEDKNVVIDDIGFNERHTERWKLLAKEYGAKFEIRDMKTPVEECIIRNEARNQIRDTGITRDIIINTAWKNDLYDKNKVWVGVDLDGTLADITVRRQMATKDDGSMDWKVFFDPENIQYDVPREDVIEAVRELAIENRCDIYILSGRSESTYQATRDWLDKHLIDHDRLLMRAQWDHRKDTELKQEMMTKFCKPSKLVKMFDDRPCVIRMWKEMGIDVENVGDGVEF